MEYLDLSISSGKSSMRFLSVYRPPPSKKNKLNTNMFLSEFSLLLETLATVNNNLLISGDFNFHVDDVKNRDAMAFLDLLDSAGLQQRVIGSTHKHGHTLDLIIVREGDTLLTEVTDIIKSSRTISDHCAVLCTAAIPRPPTSKITIARRCHHKIDLDELCNDIKNSQLIKNTDDHDLDSLVGGYNSTLRAIIDRHAPIKKRITFFYFFYTITLRPSTPWYNADLRSLKRLRRQAERRYVSTGLEVHHQMYVNRCRIYTDALNTAKRDYYRDKISESDQNQLFRVIDGLFKVQHIQPLPTCTSHQLLAEEFADFFNDKILDLKNKMNTSHFATRIFPLNW